MSVIAIERVIDGVLTSADSTTLQIRDSADAIVIPTTVIVPTSVGVYSYTTSFLPPGVYTAIWTFIESGFADDIVPRAFVVDSPMVTDEGIRLMDIERRVAKRCGTHREIYANDDCTITTVVANRIKSSQNLGSFEAEFVLRRGYYRDGSLVPNFVEDDRVRGIYSYAANTGTLTVDREYALTPQENEAIEIMYLDPEEELRPAVLEGMEICFFWDTITIATTGLGEEINLTAAAPWITKPTMVKRVQASQLNSRLPPTRIQWTEPYLVGRNVMLRSLGVYPGNVLVTYLRPHSSYVNGEMSIAGANDDLDVFYVKPDYAVWAGVRRIWETNPERVAPVAAQGMRPNRIEVARQWTALSEELVNQIPEVINHQYQRWSDLTQVGNLAEPAV